jgi:uncharacterized membrane protein
VIVDGLISLALLIILGLPLAGIISIVFAFMARSRLAAIETRLAALETVRSDRMVVQSLEARLNALEAGRTAAGSAASTTDQPLPADGGPPRADGPRGAGVPRGPPPSAGAAPGLPPSTGNAGAAARPPVSVPPVALPRVPPSVLPDLEERFGTRWVVLAGGLALALGGIFLVRYSIEQGWIGPAFRVALGALLGGALIAVGERLRRRENLQGMSGLLSVPIPSILTAAGTTVCYATVFAAYALYSFIGPAAAFVLLGFVALVTLGAALLHGPALAALGLIGAEVTPLLVRTDVPNYWALYVYLAVVTAAAFALARLRLWRWLTVTAVAFSLFWSLPGLAGVTSAVVAPHVFHAVAGFGLAAVFIVAGLFLGPAAEPGRIDVVSSGAVTVYLFVAALIVVASNNDLLALVPFALLVAMSVAIAWRSDAATAALPAAALLSALVIVAWAVEPEVGHLVGSGPGNGLGLQPSEADVAMHFALGAFFAGLFGIAGYRTQGRYAQAAIPLLWSTTAVLAPLAVVMALYYRIHGLERSLPFAAIALGLAAWFAVAAERLGSGEPRPGVPAAAALHAAGSAAALTLALTFSLEKGWLTVGLALMALATAWVSDKRPLPQLRWIAAAAAVLVLARIVWEPRIVGADLGTTPFFNWLLYGYGVPALAFWSAGYLLRRRIDDVPSRTLDAAAILFTVLFAVLEIRHAMNGGDVYRMASAPGETALHVCVGLALAIGLEWLRQRTRNIVYDAGALIIAVVTLMLILIEVFGDKNPRISGAPVGGVFVNLILLDYGLPAALAVTLALVARHTRPMPYRIGAAATAVVLALTYLTLEVMRLYHGPQLTGPVSDPESYTFSAVWLAFGVVLLTVGVPLASKPTRLASAAVVGLATAKVFLIDLASLAGIWRALSFIGLGLVLVGIGYLYQRLLFPPRPAVAPEST